MFPSTGSVAYLFGAAQSPPIASVYSGSALLLRGTTQFEVQYYANQVIPNEIMAHVHMGGTARALANESVCVCV